MALPIHFGNILNQNKGQKFYVLKNKVRSLSSHRSDYWVFRQGEITPGGLKIGKSAMPKNVLKPFCYGEELRLRDDVLPNAKVRDWIFHKMEGEKILLEHKTRICLGHKCG